jgi:hypothetical protein
MLSRRLLYFLPSVAIGIFATLWQGVPLVQLFLLFSGIALLTVLMPMPRSLSFLSAKILSAILLSAVFFQIEAILFWLLRLHVTDVYYVLTLFLTTNLWLFYIIYRGHDRQLRTSVSGLIPGIADVAVLVPAILICATTIFGDFRLGGSHQIAIIRSIAFGVDDSSHAGMLGDEYRANGNIILNSYMPYSVTYEGNASYPKGLHLDSAIYTLAFTGTQHDSATKPSMWVVDAYFTAKNVLLFLTTSVFSLALWVIANLISNNKKKEKRNAIFVIAFTLTTSPMLIAIMWWHGFFSYLPAIIYAYLFLIYMLNRNQDRSERYMFLYMALCVGGSALTWLLAAPALLISLVLCIPAPPLKPSISAYFTYLRQNYYPFLLAILATIVIGFQALVQTLWGLGVSQVNLTGGIDVPPQLFVVAIFLGLFALLLRKSVTSIIKRSMVQWLLPLLGLTIAVLFVEIIKGQGASYYFYKLEFLLLTMSCMAAFGFLLTLFDHQDRDEVNNSKVAGTLYQVSVFSMILGVLFITTTDFSWLKQFLFQLKGVRPMDKQTSEIVREALVTPYSSTGNRVYIIAPYNDTDMIVGSHMANMSHSEDGCSDMLNGDFYKSDIVTAFAQDLKKCVEPNGPHYMIYSDTPSRKPLEDLLKSEIASGEVTISSFQYEN